MCLFCFVYYNSAQARAEVAAALKKVETQEEDRRFLEIMKEGMIKDESGSWIAPLPFCKEMVRLPENKENTLKRLKSTHRLLDKKPVMKEHYLKFMQLLFDNGHAKIAPASKAQQSVMQTVFCLLHSLYFSRNLKLRTFFLKNASWSEEQEVLQNEE